MRLKTLQGKLIYRNCSKYRIDWFKDEKSKFLEEFLSQTAKKEGYLFPDTYLVPKEITAEKFIKLMENTYSQRTKDLKLNNKHLDKDQALILASLIEREAKKDEERPVIAGILINRLNADWPLQVDASIQYAIANLKCQKVNIDCDWWPGITKSDLEMKSSFNTYRNTGLPPSAISNPGLSSIKAAFDPAETEYWFYLHDPKGGIHYAKTIEEHNENVRLFLGK